MQRVEWITLMFFGAMFITMECLARMGLIKWIGSQTERLILMVDEEYRLTLAIFIILWVQFDKTISTVCIYPIYPFYKLEYFF